MITMWDMVEIGAISEMPPILMMTHLADDGEVYFAAAFGHKEVISASRNLAVRLFITREVWNVWWINQP